MTTDKVVTKVAQVVAAVAMKSVGQDAGTSQSETQSSTLEPLPKRETLRHTKSSICAAFATLNSNPVRILSDT